MLKKIALVLVVLVLGFLGFVATRPSEFKISRSKVIDAPVAVVFPIVNNFEKFPLWSPWHKLDPNQKSTFSDAKEGTGASYAWVGNDQVGEGRMTITESVPQQKIVEKLEFIKPFASTSTVTFDFAPQGEKTNVTWSMEGENNFMAKAFGVFMDMDAMVGKDFEDGLTNLARLAAETPAPAPVAAAEAAAPPSDAGPAAAP